VVMVEVVVCLCWGAFYLIKQYKNQASL
jgi:hypothetical protein